MPVQRSSLAKLTLGFSVFGFGSAVGAGLLIQSMTFSIPIDSGSDFALHFQIIISSSIVAFIAAVSGLMTIALAVESILAAAVRSLYVALPSWLAFGIFACHSMTRIRYLVESAPKLVFLIAAVATIAMIVSKRIHPTLKALLGIPPLVLFTGFAMREGSDEYRYFVQDTALVVSASLMTALGFGLILRHFRGTVLVDSVAREWTKSKLSLKHLFEFVTCTGVLFGVMNLHANNWDPLSTLIQVGIICGVALVLCYGHLLSMRLWYEKPRWRIRQLKRSIIMLAISFAWLPILVTLTPIGVSMDLLPMKTLVTVSTFAICWIQFHFSVWWVHVCGFELISRNQSPFDNGRHVNRYIADDSI